MVKPKVKPYTNAEVAFLLNYADLCLCNNTEYRQTVVSALVKHFNAQRDFGSIFDRLRSVLSAGSDEEPVLDLFALGTRSLDLETLPLELVEEMKRQRQELGLEQLRPNGSLSTTSSSDIETLESNENTGAHPRRSSRQTQNGGRIKYSEISDSDEADGDISLEVVGLKDDAADVPAESVAKRVKLTSPPLTRPTMSPLTCSTTSSATSNSSLPLPQIEPLPARDFQLPPTVTRAMTSRSEALNMPVHPESTDNQDADKPDNRGQRKRKRGDKNNQPTAKAPALPVVPTSSPPEEMSESSTASERSPPSTVILGQKRINSRSFGMQSSLPSSSQPMDSHNLEKRVGELFDWVMILAKEYMAAGKGMTPEIRDRHTSILRTMRREPGHLTERLLQDLQGADAERAEYAEILKSLIGHRIPGQAPVFPVSPSRSELNREWTAFRSGLSEAFGYLYEDVLMPKGWEVGFIAARVEDLLKPNPYPIDPMECIDEIREYLESPLTVQTLLGGFLCSQVFATPDPLCEGFYSDKAMYEHENALLTDGPESVQRADKGSAKRMFSDDSGQKRLADLASKLLRIADNTIFSAPPSVPGFNSVASADEWMRNALSLRQKLMLSPKEYRIHFFLPGTVFDPASMRAEDYQTFEIKDAQANGRTVVTCLFPALVELDPVPFGDDAKVSDLLVSNKRFFPTLQEKRAFDPKTVVSKAYVLLE